MVYDLNKMYKVYTSINLADTLRDPNNILIKDLGYFKDLNSALEKGYEYIDRYYKDSTRYKKTLKEKNNVYLGGSYSTELIIKPIKIENE